MLLLVVGCSVLGVDCCWLNVGVVVCRCLSLFVVCRLLFVVRENTERQRQEETKQRDLNKFIHNIRACKKGE